MYPENLRYSREHLWLRLENGLGRVGLTFHAQDSLGEVVFVELPETGCRLEQGEDFGLVETVKSVANLYTPVGGTVVAVNQGVLEAPTLVNRDPYGEGWLLLMGDLSPGEVERLLAADLYRRLVEEGG